MIRLCRCGHLKRVHKHYTWPGDLRCAKCLCPRWRWRSVARRVDAEKSAARERVG